MFRIRHHDNLARMEFSRQIRRSSNALPSMEGMTHFSHCWAFGARPPKVEKPKGVNCHPDSLQRERYLLSLPLSRASSVDCGDCAGAGFPGEKGWWTKKSMAMGPFSSQGSKPKSAGRCQTHNCHFNATWAVRLSQESDKQITLCMVPV